MKVKTIIACLFLSSQLIAQTIRVPPVRVVSTLGTCTDGSPKIVAVTDGVTSVDCSTGGATGGSAYDVTCYCNNGTWSAAAAASGTVTSVAATVPSALFSVEGSPVTTSGTLAFILASWSANCVFSGPSSGSAATGTCRALVSDDIPALAESKITNLVSDLAGKANSSHAHAAGDITSGTVATARLASGTADNTTFLRGDQTWATAGVSDPLTIGTVTVTTSLQPQGLAGTYKDRTVQIGLDAVAGNNYSGWGSVAVGYDVDACASNTMNSCIAYGTDAHANANSSIAIGRQVTTTGQYGMTIGFSNSTAEAGSTIAIGDGVHATAISSIAFGVNSTGSGYGSAAFGTGSTCAHTSSWCIGNSAESTAANQLIFGGTKIDATGREDTFKNVFIGSGVTNTNPLFDVTITTTGSSGTNVASKDLIIAGSRATGNAASGGVVIKTAPAGSTGTTAQTLVERYRVTPEGLFLATCLAAPPVTCNSTYANSFYFDCTDNSLCTCNGSAWTPTPLTGTCS